MDGRAEGWREVSGRVIAAEERDASYSERGRTLSVSAPLASH